LTLRRRRRAARPRSACRQSTFSSTAVVLFLFSGSAGCYIFLENAS
jgi:hypothetical protein